MCTLEQPWRGEPPYTHGLTAGGHNLVLPTLIVTAVLMTMAVQPATAQDLARYRAYALNTSVESVIAISGSRPGDVKTRHVRPARIQQL